MHPDAVALRSVAARSENPVLVRARHIPPRTLGIPVEKTRHFRGEQHIRAAVAYDDISRSIALRLKYGRKTALARTMSRYMRPLFGELPRDTLLVPVPLHRRRLWSRGFNQSAIVARDLSRRTGLPVAVGALKRTRATPPLKGMGMRQRRRTVAGAFRSTMQLHGRTVILIDDVLTTGSTANACARVLKRAGAERVDLIRWARVIRPMHIDV
jgi:ComF family protein